MEDRRILVVDDEVETCMFLMDFLKKRGYQSSMATNGREALKVISNQLVDLALLNVKMPGMSGIELIKHIKDFDHQIDIIMLTAYPSIDNAVEAVKLGAYDYLTKPIELKKLQIIIENVFEKRSLYQRVEILEDQVGGDYQFQEMVGKSPLMLKVFSTVRRIARYFTTVLITGETGTGKEMVTRAIHSLSPRKDRSFVAVNCSGLVETLLESELFGHVKGAFTGAVKTKHGLFEVADGGTIFLDEIGDLSFHLQSKLLRALENQEIQKVGSTEATRVDVRVIAATNIRDRLRRTYQLKYIR